MKSSVLESDYFAEQAHQFFRLARTSRDPYMSAKLSSFAREFAIRSISLGAAPERLQGILLAPVSLAGSLPH